MAGNAERTYLMIKPDGVQRGLVGKIVMRFEERGYKLVSSLLLPPGLPAQRAAAAGAAPRLPPPPPSAAAAQRQPRSPRAAPRAQVAMKFCAPSREHMEKHYADLSTKKFFPGLIDYMTSGPVVAMVWEGMNVVAAGRKMLGATRPQDSEPGTIRGDYCIDVGRCARPHSLRPHAARSLDAIARAQMMQTISSFNPTL